MSAPAGETKCGLWCRIVAGRDWFDFDAWQALGIDAAASMLSHPAVPVVPPPMAALMVWCFWREEDPHAEHYLQHRDLEELQELYDTVTSWEALHDEVPAVTDLERELAPSRPDEFVEFEAKLRAAAGAPPRPKSAAQ